jgi:hypothetical protein
MEITFFVAAAFMLLMETFPGKRIRLATNVAYALGSIFILSQIAVIYWPVPRSQGVVLSAPFRGEWLVLHGGQSSLINAYRLYNNQQDALTVERLVNGLEQIGDKNSPASYPSWNETVFAPADGTVTEAVNTEDDNARGDSEIPGNHVIIDIGHGHYVMLAYLKKGSLLVTPGDLVHTGRPIALCGNFWAAGHPQLQIQVQDQPKFQNTGMKTFPIFFQNVTCVHGNHQRTGSPICVRRNDHIIYQPDADESDFLGQAYFPHGDLIEISSVERDADHITVKGRYHLTSADKATLTLHITSNLQSLSPEGVKQTMNINRGDGDFELTHPHPAPGMPHVSMYANGHSFAGVYFGNRNEVVQSEKLNLEDSRASAPSSSTFQQRLQKIIKQSQGNESAAQPSQDGWQLFQTGKFSQAAEKFQQVVEAAPNDANAWAGLGWAQFDSGNSADGETSFQKALSLDSSQPGALNGLGQIYLSQRK